MQTQIPTQICRRFSCLALCGSVFITACSESKIAQPSAPQCDASTCNQALCSARFSGNSSDSLTLGDDCGALAVAADAGPVGAYLLSFHGSSTEIPSADVSIYLGAAPAAGMFSGQSVSSWSFTTTSSKNAGCEFVAGSSAVPTGNLTLTLSSLALSSADADGGGSAHGTLSATLYLHAPPNTDCGAGELEDATIVF
ncbi:MAG TPA: hypothetical protein VGM44_14220 [Polyangiaceae bacterium]|jgi:hypothetical protein